MQAAIKYVLLFLGVAITSATPHGPEMKASSLGADLESWMRIFGAVCVSPTIRDDATAKQFYDCYSLLDKKEQCLYEECQQEVFGVLLQSLPQIQKACMNSKPNSLELYIGCLQQKYQKTGRDYNRAAAIVNICDGKVLGLE